MQKITREFLKKRNVCKDFYDWWIDNCEGLKNIDQIKRLAEHRFDWANWLIVRIMTYYQYVSYAIFSAEQVINIYEEKYKKPCLREAIEAAKKCLKNPTKQNKENAASLASGAAKVAEAVYANSANFAVYTAVYATVFAASAAAYDDFYAANAASDATYARKEMKSKIINYGIKLLSDN